MAIPVKEVAAVLAGFGMSLQGPTILLTVPAAWITITFGEIIAESLFGGPVGRA